MWTHQATMIAQRPYELSLNLPILKGLHSWKKRAVLHPMIRLSELYLAYFVIYSWPTLIFLKVGKFIVDSENNASWSAQTFQSWFPVATDLQHQAAMKVSECVLPVREVWTTWKTQGVARIKFPCYHVIARAGGGAGVRATKSAPTPEYATETPVMLSNNSWNPLIWQDLYPLLRR